MKSDDVGFLYRKEILNGVIFTLGVLLLLVIFIQPGTAVVSANFTAVNQAGMPLTSCFTSGDYFYLQDNSTVTPDDSILLWNWTVNGETRLITDPEEKNQTFGPFIDESVEVILAATNSTLVTDNYTSVYTLSTCSEASALVANYTVVPAYDNRSTENPNGTVTFWANSNFISDPMVPVTNWWWRWTNISGDAGESGSISGVDHFTINLSNTSYQVNLTIEQGECCLASINGITQLPPNGVHPVSNFTVIPMAGFTPFELSVVDQSMSMVNYTLSDVPLNYSYLIANSTDSDIFDGEQFNTKNLNVTLEYPGIYNVTQTVTNSFGLSDESTVENVTVYPPGAPIANFSATVREGLAPFNVTLIDQSIGAGPFTYNWMIGNSSGQIGTSNNFNPQFQLTRPGSYWVNLSITDPYGSDFENKTDFITVGAVKYPQAAFTAVPMNGSYPLNVSFIDQSVLDPDLLANLIEPTYNWTFDDGSSSIDRNPNHVFTTADDFLVRMNITHGGLESSATQTIHVTEPSDSGINFTYIQDYGKSPYSVVFIPLGISTDWDVNWTAEKDGTILNQSEEFTARFVFPGTGLYNVSLVATKDGFTTESKEQSVHVYPDFVPDPKMKMMNPLADEEFYQGVNSWAYGYINDPIQFYSNSSDSWEDSWEWDFGDNSSSSLRSPVHRYSAPGLYTVRLKSSNVHGESLAQDEISAASIIDSYNVMIFNDVEFINLEATPTTGNAPLPVQFNVELSVNGKSDEDSKDYVVQWYWIFGVDSYEGISTEQKPNHTYQTPGTYYPRPWVLLTDGWWYTPIDDMEPITVLTTSELAVTPGFTYEIIDRNGTYGYSYKFMDTSRAFNPTTGDPSEIVTWLWDFGDGSPAGVERAPTHMFKEPGKYVVKLTVIDDVGNSGSIEKEIEIPYFGELSSDLFPAPVAGFTFAKVDNEPLSLQFIDQSYSSTPLTYNWSFGDSLSSTEKSPKHTFPAVGPRTIILKVTDQNNKSNETSKSIIVPPVNPPTAAFNFTLSDVNPLQVQFNDQSEGELNTWQWSFGDGLGGSTQSPVHLFSDFGTYPVTLTVGNSAGSLSVTEDVKIDDPKVKADFTAENIGDKTILFTDVSTGPIDLWYLDFGDGEFEIFESDWGQVTHTYTQMGIYPVRLTVSNAFYEDSKNQRITVTVTP